MTPEQAFALAHPLNRAAGDLSGHRKIRRHRLGFLVVVVLAVDR